MLTAKDPFTSLRQLLQPERRQLAMDIMSDLFAVAGLSAVHERSFSRRVVEYRDLFNEDEVAEALDRLWLIGETLPLTAVS
jgi:hypothetical protein